MPASTETVDSQEIAARVNAFLNKSGDYSDANLSPKLYTPIEANPPDVNQLGLIDYTLNEPTVSVQEVLLGGVIKGDFAYFILGTQDRNKQRFVHIGVFPTNYFKDNIMLNLEYVNSPSFKASNYGMNRLGSTEMIQKFLDDYTGTGVVTTIWYGDDPTIKVSDLTGEMKDVIQLLDSTNSRVEGIANILYPVKDTVVGFKIPDFGYGTDEGIYTSARPMTAADIDGLSFDPKGMEFISDIYVRQK